MTIADRVISRFIHEDRHQARIVIREMGDSMRTFAAKPPALRSISD